MKNLKSKYETKEEIESFFKLVEEKTPREIKRIKILAMSKNIPLKEKRKLFCKKCLTPYKNPKVRIKKHKKIVICSECGNISRWKI